MHLLAMPLLCYGNPESLHQIDHKHETEDTILTTIKRHILSPIQDLVIPPFAVFNSLIQDDINITLTNIYKNPLKPGPASSYRVIYTALISTGYLSLVMWGKTSHYYLIRLGPL